VGDVTQVTVDAFPGATWSGKITTINPEVDPATRNVRVRSTFANPGGRLRPGMFAKVEVVAPEARPVLLVPATAILYAPFGDSVFTVEQAKDAEQQGQLVARQKFVRLGERRGDFVAVSSGLALGETVVSNGAFKLRNGMAVVVKQDQAPKAELDPRPVEQ